MTGNGLQRRTVVVANPMGLHMRPAAAFAQAARATGCRVAVYHGEKRADGTSSLDLMMLIALPGAELVLEVEGDEAVAETLAAILAAEGDGDE